MRETNLTWSDVFAVAGATLEARANSKKLLSGIGKSACRDDDQTMFELVSDEEDSAEKPYQRSDVVNDTDIPRIHYYGNPYGIKFESGHQQLSQPGQRSNQQLVQHLSQLAAQQEPSAYSSATSANALELYLLVVDA